MNLTGETDGSDHMSGYLDIASVIEEHSIAPDDDLFELWHRIVFGVCINNTDDHLRNHSFVYNKDGQLMLSPLFDVNPNPYRSELSLLIDYVSNRVDIELVFDSADYFRVDKKTAHDTISSTQNTICDFLNRSKAKYHISKGDYELIYPCFRESFNPIFENRRN